MAKPEIVQDFYGVYLLYNINPKYKGRTYIGYTRDPNRRIMQHNRGTWAGGAHRTSNRGPWKMVMIIHGFPNNISALRFEWAWQNPNKTTRLQHLDLKKIPRKESEFQFKLRVLSEMLRVGPWCRLPLVIRWLENDYREEFPPERKPPEHMTICQGPVKSYNQKKVKETTTYVPTIECLICSGYLKESEKLSCLNVNCVLVSHITCLANLFLPPGEYIPINGHCPFCNTKLKWGDLIRKMNGYDKCVNKDDVENIYDENDGDIVCTQDREFVENFDNEELDEMKLTKDREFVDDYDNDDVVCTQDRVSDDNFYKSDVVCTNGRVSDDKFYNDDMVCTQDDNFDNDDVVCTQDRFDNFEDKDKIGIKNKESSDNEYGNVKKDDVVYLLDDKSNDDECDEIFFNRNKVYDDQPSWFLDCNENL